MSYRLCSLSTILSIRVLNRPNSSSDSRRLVLFLSIVEDFAVVAEWLSLNTVWKGGIFGFFVVTAVIIVGFLFVSIDNELDEHESVWSLKSKDIYKSNFFKVNILLSYFLLTESRVSVSSKSHIKSSDFKLQLSSSINPSWLRTLDRSDDEDNVLEARCGCRLVWERCAAGRRVEGEPVLA